MQPKARVSAAMLAAMGGAACADEAKDGTLEVRIWGEELIEEGIPADVFIDGWAISWTKFLVAVDGIATPQAEDPTRYLFDLTAASGGAGAIVGRLPSASGSTELAYRIGPGAAAQSGNATPDAPMMAQNGYSIFVEGTATKDAQSIAFAWGFTTETSYHECEVADDVPEGGEIRTVITIHADHLFYDDLESPTPNTTFDLVATADADMDGTVTRAEIMAVDITAEPNYQVGSQDVTNLWDFISTQSTTVGHIDGEGHCHTE